jgi:hypothetical protein
MPLLRLLALCYLAAASVFVMTATLVAHPQWIRDFARGGHALARMAEEDLVQPFPSEPQSEAIARIDLAPALAVHPAAQATIAAAVPRMVHAPDDVAQPDTDAITILPDLPAPPAPAKVASDAPHPAPAFRIPDPPSDAPVPSRGQLAAARLQAGLTPEMMKNFDLFLYVSKADNGPLSQRMYVFEKERSGELKLLHDWAASTGRERYEISPRGERTVTTTPAGYYEFDPDRMYRSYRSYNWNQDMPDAMFFNWEREGLETGLAIHAATGADVKKLGERASAGCVHLAPENAAMLFDTIRKSYRGPVPRFAYDAGGQTMSNQGRFMHDGAGKLKMSDGYRVLVRIEDYGGNGAVAALF